MFPIKSLFNSLSSCEDSVAHLLKCLNVPYTSSYLKNELKEHPNYPSLLSITDVLGISYNIATIAIKMPSIELLNDASLRNIPFIVHIKSSKGDEVFSIVKHIYENKVILYNPILKKNEVIDFQQFEYRYLGTILLAKSDSDSSEKDFKKNKVEENRKNIIRTFLFWAIPIITIILCCIVIFKNRDIVTVVNVIYTFLSLIGIYTTLLLLWHEFDKHNLFLKQICQAKKKQNCTAVLNSKKAKILGFTWSSIGFCYFTGNLLCLILLGIDNSTVLGILYVFNILTLPYIFFSVYFQSKVIKQWCPLCIAVQLILLFQFIIATVSYFIRNISIFETSSMPWLIVASVFVFIFFLVQLFCIIVYEAQDNKQKGIQLQRIKRNPLIFESLLVKQKNIGVSAKNLGITIGSPNAKIKITKVCNPYCGPCAKAHFIIDELLKQNDNIQLQIIFTSSANEDDYLFKPVSHLLNIYSKGDSTLVHEALNDWYMPEVKDYTLFNEKYPLNSSLGSQKDKIILMSEWCDKTQISFTPTFFINGYQLPQIINVSDLKYLLLS